MEMCEKCDNFEATRVLHDQRLCGFCWSRIVYPYQKPMRCHDARDSVSSASQRALDEAEAIYEQEEHGRY